MLPLVLEVRASLKLIQQQKVIFFSLVTKLVFDLSKKSYASFWCNWHQNRWLDFLLKVSCNDTYQNNQHFLWHNLCKNFYLLEVEGLPILMAIISVFTEFEFTYHFKCKMSQLATLNFLFQIASKTVSFFCQQKPPCMM